jgi:hypothetical protein
MPGLFWFEVTELMLERVGTIRRRNRPITDKCVSNGDVFDEVKNTGA